MATMATDLLAYLVTLGLGATTGTITLFENAMPASPDVCGAVFDTGGMKPDKGFGVVGIQYENPTAQIRFRGAPRDSAGPQAKARTAYAAMSRQMVTINNVVYLQIDPLQAPFLFRRDEKERCEWVFNVLAKKEPS